MGRNAGAGACAWGGSIGMSTGGALWVDAQPASRTSNDAARDLMGFNMKK
jgi:hypothetical protein